MGFQAQSVKASDPPGAAVRKLQKPDLIGPAGVMCQSLNWSLGQEECQVLIGCRPGSQNALLGQVMALTLQEEQV